MFKIGHGDIGLMGLHLPKVLCPLKVAGLKFGTLQRLRHCSCAKWSVSTSTVDGSEIRRSPVEGKVVFPIKSQGFHTSRVVGWDF